MADASATAAARSPQSDPRTQLLAQKTHLINELAEAIDNQFNNIMMSVSSYAELELKKAPPAERRSLEQMIRNAGRATHLIQKLLAFGRDRRPKPQPVQVNEIINGLADLLQQLAGERIELVLRLDAGLPGIIADPVELEQMLLSAAIQVRDAMPGGGKILLTTESVRADQTPLHKNSDAHDDNCVMISVSSSEAGKPTQSHKPSVTGHDQDLKSSLTLAAIERIVKEAKGAVRVAGESREGKSFMIYFPALASDMTVANDEPERSLSGSRTILVVEDDDAVRVPAAEFLKMEGFKVLQARTGVEAIQIAQQKRSPVDLLITDIVMPTMSGREVAKEMAEMFPGLKVLYMSGDANEASSSAAGQRSRNEVLQKPFRLDKLNEKIRSLLGE
jgi:CheY-like chemotaxis protein/nitrogen-specific signal transduction histidine kinase